VAAPTTPDSSRLRLTVVLVVVLSLFVALFARLWFLQVVNAPNAQAAVQDQGVKIVETQAPRGDILDRNGNVLVGNRTSETIEVSDRFTALDDTPMLRQLAALLYMTVGEVKQAINDTTESPSYAPAIVLSDAMPSQILYVQQHQSLFPGVSATTTTVRDYSPMGVAAANIVGYVGQITAAEYGQLKSQGYQQGFQVGQAGIEAEYNSALAGTPGVEKVQVDSQGNILSVLSSTPPVPGDNLKLTIDGNIQEAAVNAIQAGLVAARKTIDVNVTKTYFTAPAGSAVVENPQNGDILALATYPTYDPNEFVGGISDANYEALNDNPDKPLLDRTIQGLYAPGSTFKLVTATAGLEEGIITPTSSYDDVGHITIGDPPETFTNDEGEAFGPIDVTKALTVSSDNFFNQIGIDQWVGESTYGPEAEQKVAEGYGFGSPTGIKLPGEVAGEIPTPASVAEDYKEYPKDFETGTWTTGDSAQIAIGQFEDDVTPLQLTNAYSAFANGGTLWTPQLATDTETASGRIVSTFAPVKKGTTPPLTAPERAAMLAGFEGVVNDPHGTAYGIFHDPGDPLATMDIAGKTGTAQETDQQSTSVFTSFAPATNPTYEITAIMEKSGYGADVAGPVTRQIYDRIYDLPIQPIGSVSNTRAGQT
jgi:penicillin-binding protein 2